MYTPHFGMNYIALRTAQARHRAMEQANLHDHPIHEHLSHEHIAKEPAHLRRRERQRLTVLFAAALIVIGCIAALLVGSL